MSFFPCTPLGAAIAFCDSERYRLARLGSQAMEPLALLSLAYLHNRSARPERTILSVCCTGEGVIGGTKRPRSRSRSTPATALERDLIVRHFSDTRIVLRRTR